ncbi:gamma-glutamylcyclotransferase [Caenimonas koreensis DSM 17982]|uniref:Gamma-glutamylcyclotransferase n=1 Tax=Caenimonas koreensis DSM 17982 TaxID=1121255 RepID=A0A844APA1_9BURK|nr:gamma-glutamylcyclotransferase family protein [Caenimonas koreensis]MRD45900.1 gamma-glutamylcyclotransferase [Caenimonas koreensis DSM 17982]
MPEGLQRYVFVYGTLRRSGRNDINRLEPTPQFIGMGAVRGRLYHIDWYPGLTLGSDEAVDVVGEVYAIEPALEALLDGYEGIESGLDSEYFKRDLEIDVDGRAYPCLVYEANPAFVRGKTLIGHGDWILFSSGANSIS